MHLSFILVGRLLDGWDLCIVIVISYRLQPSRSPSGSRWIGVPPLPATRTEWTRGRRTEVSSYYRLSPSLSTLSSLSVLSLSVSISLYSLSYYLILFLSGGSTGTWKAEADPRRAEKEERDREEGEIPEEVDASGRNSREEQRTASAAGWVTFDWWRDTRNVLCI